MRRVLAYLLVTTAFGGVSTAAERTSWKRIRYIGGTLPIKNSSYDWDTTVSISSNPDRVEVLIAPSSAFGHQQTLTLRPSQITALVEGPGARQRVADIPGASLLPKPHGLFGLLNRGPLIMGKPDPPLAVLFQSEDGKAGALLLSCEAGTHTDISLGRSLSALTGKPVIYAK